MACGSVSTLACYRIGGRVDDKYCGENGFDRIQVTVRLVTASSKLIMDPTNCAAVSTAEDTRTWVLDGTGTAKEGTVTLPADWGCWCTGLLHPNFGSVDPDKGLQPSDSKYQVTVKVRPVGKTKYHTVYNKQEISLDGDFDYSADYMVSPCSGNVIDLCKIQPVSPTLPPTNLFNEAVQAAETPWTGVIAPTDLTGILSITPGEGNANPAVTDGHAPVFAIDGTVLGIFVTTTMAPTITTLTTNVATNAAGILANGGLIAGNTAAIVSNDADIAALVVDIATNVTNIGLNALGLTAANTLIVGNTAAIVSNDGDITTNAAAIAANTTLANNNLTAANAYTDSEIVALVGASPAALDTLVELGAAIIGNDGDIAGLTTQVATNVTNIATNVTNIATNTGNINTNATNIATNAGSILTNAADIGLNSTNIGLSATQIAANQAAIAALPGVSVLTDGIVVGIAAGSRHRVTHVDGAQTGAVTKVVRIRAEDANNQIGVAAAGGVFYRVTGQATSGLAVTAVGTTGAHSIRTTLDPYKLVMGEAAGAAGLSGLDQRQEHRVSNNNTSAIELASSVSSVASGNQSATIAADGGAAIGANTIVSGENNTANGTRSFMTGSTNVDAVGATANIINGFGNNANNTQNSIISGITNDVIGNATLVTGQNNNVVANQAIVGGSNNIVAANQGITTGNFNNVGGTAAQTIVVGTGSTITGNGQSLIVGFGHTHSGERSVSIGNAHTVSGNDSVAMGFGHTVSGNQSTSFGNANTIDAPESLAIGAGNTVNVAATHASALGRLNVLNGREGAAIGSNLIQSSRQQIVVGTFNQALGAGDADSILNDPVFIVGVGTDNATRHNALVGHRWGGIGINRVRADHLPFVNYATEAAANTALQANVGSAVRGEIVTVSIAGLETPMFFDNTNWINMTGAGGGGGGATTLAALTDTDVTGITDGQVMAWEAATNTFKPVAPATGGGTVDCATIQAQFVGVLRTTIASDFLLLDDGAGGCFKARQTVRTRMDWSYDEYCLTPSGIAPKVCLHDGFIAGLGIAASSAPNADETWEVAVNGTGVGQFITLAAGSTSATSLGLAILVTNNQVMSLIPTTATPGTPSTYGNVTIEFEGSLI